MPRSALTTHKSLREDAGAHSSRRVPFTPPLHLRNERIPFKGRKSTEVPTRSRNGHSLVAVTTCIVERESGILSLT